MFGLRLHWYDSDIPNSFRVYLYYYDGTTCSSVYYSYSGNPVYSTDCSSDPVNTRFFPNWEGGTIFMSVVRNDRNSWDDCNSHIFTNIIYIYLYIYMDTLDCGDGIEYPRCYPGYPVHNMAFLFRTSLSNRIPGINYVISDLTVGNILFIGIYFIYHSSLFIYKI